MKRTRKWAFIGQEAERLAGLGMTPREIADKLDVQKSTVTRWIASGKLTRPGKRRPSARPPKGPKAPAQWAESVREAYALDSTDEQLVTAGQQALELAYNMAETPTTRLNAMGRFQSIVKQLSLGLSDRKAPEKPEAPVRPAPQAFSRSSRVGGVDPRQILHAVKA